MRNLARVMSYLLAMMLGAYATAEYKFSSPVEDYRWVITFIFFGWFLVLTNKDEKK